MSSAWSGGSPNGWKELRKFVLERDDYRCTIKLYGCMGKATQVHHKLGVRHTGIVCHPDLLTSACAKCNRAIGEPTNVQLQGKKMTEW